MDLDIATKKLVAFGIADGVFPLRFVSHFMPVFHAPNYFK